MSVAESEISQESKPGSPLDNPAIVTGANPAPVRSLRARVMSAGLWSVANYCGSNLIRLGSSLVLTRLLMPHDYGMFALVTAYTVGLAWFSDIGLTSYLFQSGKACDQRFANCIWSIGIIRGAIVWLCGLLLAFPMASFYGRPELSSLLIISSLTLLLREVQATSLTLARREMRQKELAIFTAWTQCTQVLILIALAWHFRSVWALVWGGVAGEFVRSVGSQFLFPGQRNSWRWEAGVLAEVRSFSFWILLSSVTVFFGTQLDRLMLGKLASMEFLGVYSVALTYVSMPTALVVQAFALMSPVIVELRHSDTSCIQHKLARLRRSVLSLGVILVAVMAVAAHAFFGMLYDDRYAEAANLAVFMVFPIWATVLNASVGGVTLAFGDSRSEAISNAVQAVASVVGMSLGFCIGGRYGLVLGTGIGPLSCYLVKLRLIRNHGISLGSEDWRFCAALLVAAGVSYALASAISHFDPSMSSAAVSVAATLLLAVPALAALWALRASWLTKGACVAKVE